MLYRLGLSILLLVINARAVHAEVTCDIGQGYLKFGALSKRAQKIAIGDVRISCRNLSDSTSSTEVVVFLSDANNYEVANERNGSRLTIRLYSDDAFTVPLGKSGQNAVLLKRVLQLDGGGVEEIIMPIYAVLEVGNSPTVGDYVGNVSIQLKLEPAGVGGTVD